MNRFLFASLLLCFLFIISWLVTRYQEPTLVVKKEVEDGWYQYESPSGVFSVAFPLEPQQERDIVNDSYAKQPLQYEMYVSEELGGALYMVNTITYPSHIDLSNDNALFKTFIDDMVASNSHNKLISSSPVNFEGRSGLRFDIQSDQSLMISLMFRVGRTLYVLSQQSQGGDKRGDFEKFLSSFKIHTVKD